jgi:DNA (cytosine-5)-methyltransferase 1
MLTTLGQAGYLIEWRVVNAADYGFPQRRIRVFIVGTRIDGPLDNPDPEQTIFQDGILATALPVEPNDAGVAQIEISSNAESVSLTFGQGLKFSPFANAGVFVNGTAHTAKVRAKSRRKPRTLGDVLLDDREVPEEYWVEPSRVTEWEFLKGAKSLDRVHKESGFIYRYSEGSMAFPDHLDRPSRTILTGEGGSSASRFKHIIQIGTRFRRLVPVELERLSGFPDGWTNPPEVANISDSRRAFFIGNALVVGLIEMVGQELAKRVNRESS